MSLIDIFNIKSKDIVTIVGAGGKTSLMFSASSLLRRDYKVLITTTTKIYIPEEKFYDEMFMLSDFENEEYKKIIANEHKGVYVIGNCIVNNSKIEGLNFEILDKIIPYFDIVIIEGDGSKKKSLKGWNDHEPVIYHKTTKTIGIVDISTIDMNINEENIHRLDKFLDIINDELRKWDEMAKINMLHLQKMILNKKGLFKKSKGEAILFINKVENMKNKKNTLKLIKNIKNKNSLYIDEFIYGSIFNNEYIKG